MKPSNLVHAVHYDSSMRLCEIDIDVDSTRSHLKKRVVNCLRCLVTEPCTRRKPCSQNWIHTMLRYEKTLEKSNLGKP